ncbi:MAG: hypothetical protein KO463_03120 [Candidatus Methanofastidiosa archaeon]|jgi:DNA replication initiation complex subunit (GINS family)|nr:hypothetical protein [Candidatus Methanofastidiosa archaeon]
MKELDLAVAEEVSSPNLAAINEGLFERVARHIRLLEERALAESGIENELLIAELADVRKKTTALFEERVRKITCLDDSELLSDEQKIFKHVLALKQQYRKELLDPILRGKYAYERDGFIKAKVKVPIPSFLDGELKKYGPYRPGDVDHFPERIHALLKTHGYVE